ncbi:UvrD-helicase domain-containing protein [Methylovulum psychrotolerans]|uniref:DNA helicase II n=1 Tax=Methylovulum psychrotolerans TaxID=1704499 RepID=A0A1Z4C4R6_9GAMM|nr:UvrD-helicase domain-containing protein [Methylovulum psychrotolerans]ASF48532.1 DNA helicase II [Methylovulum psychrotolerans]
MSAVPDIRCKYGKSLRAANQQIACITYTNVAVENIKRRTNLDELFAVSTIHGFLWGLVENYQSDICNTLRDQLIPERIEKKRQEDNGGRSVAAQKAREQVVKLQSDLDNLQLVEKFSYDDSGRRDFSTGSLSHDDIVDLVSMMILRLPNLQKIIGQKFPYIFIDEAQDTFGNVMKALNQIASEEGLPMIGYFGDPMQQIYENRAGQFSGPNGYRLIKKTENYRCSKEVIKLLNAIRPDLRQTSGPNNVIGSVEIRLIKAESGNGDRNTYTDAQLSSALNQFDSALAHFQWNNSDGIKQLFLTRQMIAHRIGFSKLNQLFTGCYASQTAEDSFKQGEHFALKPFIEVLIPLVEAHKINDHAAIIQILREYSPLLDPEGASKDLTIKTVTEKAQTAINALVSIWSNQTVKKILNVASQHGLISLSERLTEHLQRKPRSEVYNETEYGLEKGDWLMDKFLTHKTNELASYRKFILDLTPYSTQHGVKGDEFEKVLVFFDDTEANWNIYSFSKLLTPISVGKEPTAGQKQKSLNLAYVCFSRAIQDLRVIMFTENPIAAKQEFISNKIFRDEQITIQ